MLPASSTRDFCILSEESKEAGSPAEGLADCFAHSSSKPLTPLQLKLVVNASPFPPFSSKSS